MDYSKDEKLGEVNTVIDEKQSQYYTDVFSPGETKEQLEIGKEVRGSTVSGNYKIGYFTITATGSKVITGVGFTPKSLQIISTVSGITYPLYSDGWTDGTLMNTYRQGRNNAGFIQYHVTDNIVSVSDYIAGWQEDFASITSFDTDGFTLNVTTRTHTVECTYIANG